MQPAAQHRASDVPYKLLCPAALCPSICRLWPSMITVLELTKLLSAAKDACDKCNDGVDAAEEGRAIDALRVLSQQVVTTDLLTQTDAGRQLKQLSKHPRKKVAAAATAAVAAWKECIRKEQASLNNKPQPVEGRHREGSAAPSQSSQGDAEPNIQSQGPGGGANSKAQRTASLKDLNLEPTRTGDETRDKIRKLLAEGLAMAITDEVIGNPGAVADEVEQALFVQNGGVNQKYKTKFRSLSFNLKDPKNPDLRYKVLSGEIPGDVLVTLSAEEMASSDMRAKNDQIRENMKNEAVRGQTTAASTDMFQCGRCKQRKCTYYQMQTRSADEPMTTFVTCTNCGNRWKFC